MGLLHGAVQTALASEVADDPGSATVLRPTALGMLVGAAVLWSALDSWRGRPGVGRTWFVAALVTGPVAGLLGWLGQSLLVDSTGLSALGPALLGGAAFTALLVLVPAGLGCLVGRAIARPAR